jgi:hypothetical protein
MLRGFLALLLVLTATGCDLANKKSDYIGGFVTQTGNCSDTGKSSIVYENKQIEIEFYCFIKKCGDLKGRISQGGYFHMTDESGYFIEGQITPYEANGKWFLNMKGEECSGHWSALKN